MPILRDVPIALTLDQALEAQKSSSPALAEVAGQAIDLAQSLYAPAVVYAEIPVHEVAGERVTLLSREDPRERHVLKIGPHADLLSPATELLAAVFTIGPALEERVARLSRVGDALAAYWLDTVGVLALGAVGETMRGVAEERATARGWGVSAALSPGSLAGWPIEGQRELCALLPLADIGVHLSSYCVLRPHKSVSMVIGMGPGYESHQVGSVCHYCSLADSCWRRR